MKKIFLFLILFLSLKLNSDAQNVSRIEAAKGACYGMTASGGNKGYGVIYQYNTSNGQDTIPVNFSNGGIDGVYPEGSLMQAANGKIYGMTSNGGTYNLGTLFMFDPATNKDTVLVNFNGANGSSPGQSNLMQASNGLLYGMTPNGGKFDAGVIFSFNTLTNVQTVLVSIGDSIGVGPQGGLIEGSNHLLYGMTITGGLYAKGTLFAFNTLTNKDTVLLNFNDTNGAEPWGNLLQANDGMLYGMTSFGGSSSQGVLFRYDPVTYKDSVLLNFNNTNGASPNGSLIQDTNGLLYGMTEFGGTGGNGVIFNYDIKTYKDSVLLNFVGLNGSAPFGSLLQGSNGLLYGLTWGGGNYNLGNGTLFSFDTKTGQDSVIVNFQYLGNAPSAGFSPYGSLIQASNGRFYGLTAFGGLYNNGVLFSYYPGNLNDSTLHSFGGNSNLGNFMLANDGKLYGVTQYGGTMDMGTLFRYDPNTGKDTTLLSFTGANGALPAVNNTLAQATDGWLYGMTEEGGTTNQGVLFKFNPVTYKDSTIINFTGFNGVNPSGGLLQAKDGLFYGMTVIGGTHNAGLIFRFNPKTNQDTILMNFDTINGSWPYSTFIQAKDGFLYGMTIQGGTYNLGTIFRYDPKTFKDTVLINFNDTNGGYPYGNLLQGIDGKIYGLSSWTENSPNYYGNLFRYDPKTGQDTVLYYFDGTVSGASPMGTLVQDSSTGLLYGTTSTGGSNNYGTLFSYNPYTYKDSVLITFADTNGANPTDIVLVNGTILNVNEVKPETEVILVYPNPFSIMANVVFSVAGKHFVEVDNLLGEKLEEIESNTKQCQINRKGKPAGIYFIKVYDANKKFVASSKIIVRN